MKKKYGKTDEERKAAELLECREIVKTIMEYGVTQKQIIQICRLLSLELENTRDMKRLSSLTNDILSMETSNEQTVIV